MYCKEEQDINSYNRILSQYKGCACCRVLTAIHRSNRVITRETAKSRELAILILPLTSTPPKNSRLHAHTHCMCADQRVKN